MNADTYALRRKVIDIIYLLKNHLDLPRIEVRITDTPHDETLAIGTMDHTSVIWVTEKAVNMEYAELLHIVAHEIGHAVYKKKHNEKCPLMAPVLNKPCSLEKIIQVLKK